MLKLNLPFFLCALGLSQMAFALDIDGWRVQQTGDFDIRNELTVRQEVETYTGDISIYVLEKKPSSNIVYVLVPIEIIKQDQTKSDLFDPSQLKLVIDNQSFTRLSEDSFLSDYNITPLPWLRMKKGTHKGTLIYEIPDTLQKERMSLTYKDQPIDK